MAKKKTSRLRKAGACVMSAVLASALSLPATALAATASGSITAASVQTQATANLYEQYSAVLERATWGSDEFASDNRSVSPAQWAPAYAVFDVSADGTPELLVRTQVFGGATSVKVYTAGKSDAALLCSYQEGSAGTYGNSSGELFTLATSASASSLAKVNVASFTAPMQYVMDGTPAQVYSYLSNKAAKALAFTPATNTNALSAGAKYSISKATLSIASVGDYDGTAKTPVVTVKTGNTRLTQGTDYTVSYANNVNAGTATVTVNGKGNYNGTVSGKFTINKAQISRATIASIPSVTYKGSAYKPAPTLKTSRGNLKKGTDYTVSYANNVNAGAATVTVKGKGNYTGTRTTTFTINKAQITSASVAKIANMKYTGKAIKPKPTVKFKSKNLATKYYTLTYKKNKKKGTATIYIAGKGNFTGKRMITFKIV